MIKHGCWVAAVAAAALLSGCALKYSERAQNPFQGLGPQVSAPDYDLVLAQALSESSQIELSHAKQGFVHWHMELDRVFEIADAPLERSFKTVVKVSKPQVAASVNADLAVVLDILPSLLGAKEVSVRALFLTIDGKPIDDIRIHAGGPLPNLLMGVTDKKSLKMATQDAARQFEDAVANSSKIQSFASMRSQKNTAVAAAVPARMYRSEADAPKYSFPESPDNFALVVGIETYASLPPAQFAERDAQSVRDHLVSLGYPRRNIVYLAGAQAGKGGLEKYLEAWLPRNVNEKSKVFFYFSGHGAPDTKTGEAYLVPQDGDAKFLETTGYPIRRLYEKLNALKAKEVLVAIDSCFSGAGGRSVLPRGTRPLITKIDSAEGLVGRLVVLTASASDEITGTAEDQGHGLFTYHLLSGINESKGTATVRSLYEYIRPKVQEGARLENRDQTPQLLSGSTNKSADTPLK